MTKKGLFSIFLLLTGILVFTSSCSSDDNEDRQNDALEFDATPAQDYDGISIDFKLLNSDNIALKSFREGEDILFSLKIENNRDEENNDYAYGSLPYYIRRPDYVRL